MDLPPSLSSRPTAPAEGWQAALSDAVEDPAELCRLLDLPPKLAAEAEPSARQFPLRVPRTYLARMHPGCPDDPLLAQVLPTKEELLAVPGFVRDPLGEAGACPRAYCGSINADS